MKDLKFILMELGNRLVQERGYEPATGKRSAAKSTHAIRHFTEWLNDNPDAQELLRELGLKWPM